MKLVSPDMIPKIDEFAVNELKITEIELMRRSANAVAFAVREISGGGELVILAGKGNNGGDGYATAAELSDSFSVSVLDVFSAGQRSDAGNYWLDRARECGVEFLSFEDAPERIKTASCIVDAIFGTGFSGKVPESLGTLAKLINNSGAKVVAVDVPLGVNAYDGSVNEISVYADVTVALSYVKPGLLSYPAKSRVGRIIECDIGLDRDKIERKFDFNSYYFDEDEARRLLPVRNDNSNKGTFGKTLLAVGSERYAGAAHLALESALRGGCGITYVATCEKLCTELRSKFPEAIYLPLDMKNPRNVNEALQIAANMDSVLVGCGSMPTLQLAEFTMRLIRECDTRTIIDADAITALSRYCSAEVIKSARRSPILTPHPLEFSRISGLSTEQIQSARIASAKSFAREYGAIVLLKGAATVVTDGDRLYINGSGSSALAKGGSGDVLSGLIASMTAQGVSALEAAALCAYLHGRAADSLEEELSAFGVTPSDLPREIAKVIRKITDKA